MRTFLKSFLRDESGAAAVKYALLLVLVGIALVAGALALIDAIDGAMSEAPGCSDDPGATDKPNC